MMVCEQARRWLPAYVLGELEEPERAGIAAHLASCEACRREEARAAHALAALRSMPEVPPSALRRERALAAARALEPAPRRRRWAWGASVAALLVVVFLLRGAFRGVEPFALRVDGVEGVVEREVAGTWVAASVGEPVGEGERVRTLLGRATLRSRSGDLLVLDVDSVLFVDRSTEHEEGVLLASGRVWCEATKRTARRLIVRTPAGRVEVVGTKFEVTYR